MILKFKPNKSKRRPVKLKFFKTSMFPKRSKVEWKLIDKNPFGDKDGDGVKNFFDCKPLNKRKQEFQKFKPRSIRDVDSFTAAERFGGKNLQKLKKLGSGRDRIVYQLDKDKVLKVAKNIGGLRQNIPEKDLDNYLQYIKHYETGKDYVVMEKVDKPNKATLKLLQDLKKEPSSAWASSGLTPKERDVLEKHGYSDLANYDISSGDLKKRSSWGEKKGKPVLIDAGVLTGDESLRNPYNEKRIRSSLRHWKNMDPNTILPSVKRYMDTAEVELKEWDEIRKERKEFSKKGQTKEYDRDIKIEEQPETLQSLDAAEEVNIEPIEIKDED